MAFDVATGDASLHHSEPAVADGQTLPIANDDNANEATFHSAQWQDTDSLALAPALIPIGHIPRAWERRSKAFSSRQSSRASKAWRRPGVASNALSDRLRRPPAFQTVPFGSPRVAVKKLCLDSSFGIGQRVSQWEAHGSPSRKIVTRSAQCSKDDLLALDEEETADAIDAVDADNTDDAHESEEIEGTILEIFDEQGNAIVTEEGEEEEAAWEDEEPLLATVHTPAEEQTTPRDTPQVVQDSTGSRDSRNHIFSAIPEGFVSPIKSIGGLKPRQLKSTPHSKRKSLPAEFAPLPFPERATNHEAEESENAVGCHRDRSPEGVWEDVEEQNHETFEEAGVGSPASLASERLSSPIPTIEGHHPRLPLRRSPWRASRRQSASPMKQRTAPSWASSTHILALSPIKQHRSIDESDDCAANDILADSTPEPEREEEQEQERADSTVPPPKATKPRLSDDTALLQAFLNRAAESKSSRLGAIDGDGDDEKQTVSKQPPCDVLAELDPNTPSPKKSVEYEDQDGDKDAMPRTRSGRTRKRPESLIADSHKNLPNKISIRNKATNVGLKKTESQEVALITRNNTRKNKSHAVLPLFRLKQLAAETSAEDPTISELCAAKKTGRSVTWAAKLVSFSSDPRDSPVTAPPRSEIADSAEPVESSADIEQRSTNNEPPRVTIEAAEIVPTRKRRSRIATPAKGLGTTSLLPDDLLIETVAEAIKKPAPTKRPVSKLPAPANYALGQGKENMIAASPAKRVARTGMDSRRRIEPPAPRSVAVSLSSPAKKGTRGIFDAIQLDDRSLIESAIPGLMSPAKRRTRRVAME